MGRALKKYITQALTTDNQLTTQQKCNAERNFEAPSDPRRNELCNGSDFSVGD